MLNEARYRKGDLKKDRHQPLCLAIARIGVKYSCFFLAQKRLE
jgi:hypothetical protein